jgi:hypothetical protein
MLLYGLFTVKSRYSRRSGSCHRLALCSIPPKPSGSITAGIASIKHHSVLIRWISECKEIHWVYQSFIKIQTVGLAGGKDSTDASAAILKSHLDIIWTSSGHHLGIIWTSSGHHLGIIWALARGWARGLGPSGTIIRKGVALSTLTNSVAALGSASTRATGGHVFLNKSVCSSTISG